MEINKIQFFNLGLDKWLLANTNYLRYSNPTDVQLKVIPRLIKSDSVDLVAIAKTGTGKTASFCLPLLNKLAMDPCGIFAVILEPTRELAVQVLEKLKVYSAGFNLRIQMIIGGMDITEQLVKMDSIPHILVATPGRLAYLLQYSPEQFKFIRNLKYLILDEFDQLLNDTITPDVQKIISYLPSERQTLFFSATINDKLHNEEYFKQFCKPNSCVEIYNFTDLEPTQVFEENINKSKSKLPDELQQKYVLIPKITKEHYLINLMQNEYKKKYTIIFVSNCKQCQFISGLLELFSIKVSVIHSQMPQRKRFESLEKFKAQVHKVLVATDLASRGLDIPLVELVINFDLPRNPDDYIHRVGRTARAGQSGLAVSFVSQFDVELVLAIEESIGNKMEELVVPESVILENLSLVSKGIKIVQMKMYETKFDEKVDKRKKRNKNRKEIE
jgi:ATP-dependent RNA helicase DDX49/DBP8